MAKFSVSNTLAGSEQALSTSFKTLASVFATTGALARGYVYELNFGPDGAPNATDCGINWDLSRQTADGTATSATPLIIDPGSSTAAVSTAKVNYTAEGTVTAASSVWSWAGNQRAGFRWFAYDYSARLGFPATANAGFAFRAKSTNYTGTAAAQLFFEE